MFSAHSTRASLVGVLLFPLAACGRGDPALPTSPVDQIELTAGQINSLDSTGRVMEQNNSSDPTVKALVDSTLLVLTSGIVAKRLNVTTDLTLAPLYFVGVHRVYTGAASFATWTVVGMDDPSHLTSIIELGAYSPSNTESVNGPLSDVLNGLLLSVASGGMVTEWFASSGSGSIASSGASTPCPNFPATPNITCTLETMHVSFSLSGASTSTGTGARRATVSDVDIPAMRLTYAIP